MDEYIDVVNGFNVGEMLLKERIQMKMPLKTILCKSNNQLLTVIAR